MAVNKKSALLYCDLIHTVDKLTNEEAGKLFKHYLMYINDMNPKTDDRLIELLFSPIKENLKRDLRKWEQKSERNKTIAIEGWDKRKNANACERIKVDAKHADKDTVTVTVTDNVKVKESLRSNVSLHRTEFEKLQSQFSEDELNWMFDKLSAYKLSNGKNYKSDYGAICSWVIDRLKEEKLKEKNSAKKENGKTTNKTADTIAGVNSILEKRGLAYQSDIQQANPD